MLVLFYIIISIELITVFYNLFLKGVKENNIKLDNPEVALFMIIELVSSTCCTSILEKRPLPIDEYKPYLYKTIRQFIK